MTGLGNSPPRGGADTNAPLGCRGFRRALETLRDGGSERGSPLDRRMQEHLASCASCRILDADERTLLAALVAGRAATARTQAPPGFAARVARNAATAGARRRSHRPLLGWTALAAAASAAFALLVLPALRHEVDVAPRARDAAGSPASGSDAAGVARAAAPSAADELGPLLWSDGMLDIVAPAGGGSDAWLPAAGRAPVTTAVLMEYSL